MGQTKTGWVRVKALTPDEKAMVTARCDAVIVTSLKPRFLPEVRPTGFNYPIDIFGRWRGSKYSFITRYRSGFPENQGEEFDAAFARFDHVEEQIGALRFNVMWHRHTGQWYCLHAAVELEDALRLIVSDSVLSPPI